jgi:hypothetical protein
VEEFFIILLKSPIGLTEILIGEVIVAALFG